MKILTLATAALLLSWPSGVSSAQTKRASEVGTAAFKALSVADRLHAQELARFYGTDARDIAALRQKGNTWEDSGEAASLASSWGLELVDVAAAHVAGHDWFELEETARLAASSGFSFGTVLTMRESGMSWTEVAEEVAVGGVDMRDAPRDPAPVRASAPRKAAKPALKATVIKGKGPKMDPARLRGVW